MGLRLFLFCRSGASQDAHSVPEVWYTVYGATDSDRESDWPLKALKSDRRFLMPVRPGGGWPMYIKRL